MNLLKYFVSIWNVYLDPENCVFDGCNWESTSSRGFFKHNRSLHVKLTVLFTFSLYTVSIWNFSINVISCPFRMLSTLAIKYSPQVQCPSPYQGTENYRRCWTNGAKGLRTVHFIGEKHKLPYLLHLLQFPSEKNSQNLYLAQIVEQLRGWK